MQRIVFRDELIIVQDEKQWLGQPLDQIAKEQAGECATASDFGWRSLRLAYLLVSSTIVFPGLLVANQNSNSLQ